MGDVVSLLPHATASIRARTSKVKPSRPFRLPRSTRASQCGEGMPRGRHELTVDGASANASATSPVPPRASMISSAVSNIASLIVRSVRTSQEFATSEKPLAVDYVRLPVMADPIKVIARRLVLTREALGFDQAEFATAIGLAKNVYNPFEKGKRRITIDAALQIYYRFGISLDWIYAGNMSHLPVHLIPKLSTAA